MHDSTTPPRQEPEEAPPARNALLAAFDELHGFDTNEITSLADEIREVTERITPTIRRAQELNVKTSQAAEAFERSVLEGIGDSQRANATDLYLEVRDLCGGVLHTALLDLSALADPEEPLAEATEGSDMGKRAAALVAQRLATEAGGAVSPMGDDRQGVSPTGEDRPILPVVTEQRTIDPDGDEDEAPIAPLEPAEPIETPAWLNLDAIGLPPYYLQNVAQIAGWSADVAHDLANFIIGYWDKRGTRADIAAMPESVGEAVREATGDAAVMAVIVDMHDALDAIVGIGGAEGDRVVRAVTNLLAIEGEARKIAARFPTVGE